VLVDAATKLARGCTAEAVTVLRGALALNPARVAHVALLVEALVAAGDLDAAASLLAPGSPIRDTALLPREAARLARAAGLVAVAGGDREQARTQFALALETFSRLELPYEVACTELDLAELLAEDDPAAASARASYALRGFQQLGAATGVARTAALLRGLGATPGPGPRDHGLLTRREQEVLDLLGHGLSNPEIAERLFLSPRTVGHHVSSILRKLGLRSRAEAAAYAARKGSPR
jgi:DNA-binding CsgD family transcriptional regulator